MFTRSDPNSTGGRTVTKEQEKATIAALLEEKRGYELRKQVGSDQARADDPVDAAAGRALVDEMDERLGGVTAQLKALGHGAQKRSAKAEKRPSSRGTAAAKR